MKFLLLIAEFDPDTSANTICIKNVLGVLGDKYHSTIDVISITMREKAPIEQMYDYGTIYRLYSMQVSLKRKDKRWYSISSNTILIRLYYAIFRRVIWPSKNILSVKSMTDKALNLMEKVEYDCIIASSGDYAIQKAALRIQRNKKNSRLVSILLDPMPSQNPHYNRIIRCLAKTNKLEREITYKSDAVLIENNLKAKGSDSSHIYGIGLPNIVKGRDIDLKNAESENVEILDIVYAGSLDSKIRNPEYILHVLHMLNRVRKLKLTVYTWTKNRNLNPFLKYAELFQIEIYDALEHEELLQRLRSADFLLNIGNNDLFCVPSKLFDYLSTGRPIINVVKLKHDPTIEIINKYRNGVNIFESDDWNKSTDRLVQSGAKTNGTVPFEEIARIFQENTPEYTASIIHKSCLVTKRSAL